VGGGEEGERRSRRKRRPAEARARASVSATVDAAEGFLAAAAGFAMADESRLRLFVFFFRAFFWKVGVHSQLHIVLLSVIPGPCSSTSPAHPKASPAEPYLGLILLLRTEV
jgi:hypothetical protein